MAERIIHIVGLQKSGTSLLVRLLENTHQAQFLDGRGKTEGGIDWGNRPSFSPTEWPAGTIYQKSKGKNGHEIGEDNATPDICAAMREKTSKKLATVPTPLAISKTPYDMVRIPWVRAIFPELYIVGIVRLPIPNVFSLWKRFQPNSVTRGPEEGWWGVKPRGWRKLVSEDKIAQIAHQWRTTNTKMWQDRKQLDLVVSYHSLCADPTAVVSRIMIEASRGTCVCDTNIPVLRSCDDEYKKGARLLPKRHDWIQSNNLVLSEDNDIELKPFTEGEVERITKICQATLTMMRLSEM